MKRPEPEAVGGEEYEGCIYLIDAAGSDITTLLRGVWDYDKLRDWFLENEYYIIGDGAPFVQCQGESLAESFWRAWDSLPEWELLPDTKDPDDPRRAVLFDYRTRHRSTFPTEGIILPELFFGVGLNGPEVSSVGAPGAIHRDKFMGAEWEWEYFPVDYPEFYSWLRSS
ncbi:hypothetical protein [Gordonia polyisoprenivorans]|uniref:hypothetical protein n=1 Tax=Gordonia polyisoprenivorans TaxID=84595 RepID=UPI001AD6F93F|nr:hypothetical protein [Gordonia polyisoprenivorans]QTI69256.1 hypothetical protein J6U32_01015 [Gordonia polyisoprenivorans]